MMTLTRTDYDVWWCAKCDCETVRPSVPHANLCDRCGAGMWWRRFEQGGPYTVQVETR